MDECVIYSRVSDKDKQGDGFSIPAQLELLRKHAAQNRLKVVQEFIEMETARKPGRVQFNAMLELLKKRKKPIALLAEKTDRLYRNLPDYIETDDLINHHNVEIHFVKENEIDGKSASSNAKFMRGIKVLLAKQYVENLSEEVKKGQRQKIKEGGWCWVAPYGYKMVKGDLVIDKIYAPLVKRAFEIYSQGRYSIHATIQRLYEEGHIYRPHASKISKTKLSELLRCRIYAGEIEYNGEIFQGKHEPIVDRATWLNVQQALRKGNKPMTYAKNEFLYRGFLKCGECGKAMVGEEKKGGRYTYYRCCDFKKSCGQGYINESKVHAAISLALSSLTFTEETKERIKEALKQLGPVKDNTVADEAERINKEINRLTRNRSISYQHFVDGLIDADMWQVINLEYNDKMLQLENNLGRIRYADNNYYDLGSLYIELPEILQGDWLNANMAQRKRILFFATSNLIAKDGKVSVELNEPLNSLRFLENELGGGTLRPYLERILSLHAVTIRAFHQDRAA